MYITWLWVKFDKALSLPLLQVKVEPESSLSTLKLCNHRRKYCATAHQNFTLENLVIPVSSLLPSSSSNHQQESRQQNVADDPSSSSSSAAVRTTGVLCPPPKDNNNNSNNLPCNSVESSSVGPSVVVVRQQSADDVARDVSAGDDVAFSNRGDDDVRQASSGCANIPADDDVKSGAAGAAGTSQSLSTSTTSRSNFKSSDCGSSSTSTSAAPTTRDGTQRGGERRFFFFFSFVPHSYVLSKFALQTSHYLHYELSKLSVNKNTIIFTRVLQVLWFMFIDAEDILFWLFRTIDDDQMKWESTGERPLFIEHSK
jgi:hypothetical protein